MAQARADRAPFFRDPVFEPFLSSDRIDPTQLRQIWAVRANHGHSELPGLTLEDTQHEAPTSVFGDAPYLFHVAQAFSVLGSCVAD